MDCLTDDTNQSGIDRLIDGRDADDDRDGGQRWKEKTLEAEERKKISILLGSTFSL